MSNLKNELVLQINHYLKNEISRNELCLWAKKIKSELLKGDSLISIDNSVLYPIISELAISLREMESCDDESIKRFLRILGGKEKYQYFWFMKLPKKEDESIIQIIKVLDFFNEKGIMADEHVKTIENLKKKRINLNESTFYDILFDYIVNMVSILPFKKGLDLNVNSCYFDAETINIDHIISKIQDYIKCFSGEKEFAVNVELYGEKNIITISI
jgi:hypothetical protein